MPWEKKPAIESGGPVCTCCGTPTQIFPPESLIAVGLGHAGVTRDGAHVYSEPQGDAVESEWWNGAMAEQRAAADPDHDWRIYKYAALYEAEYQRHGPGQWVLIRRGEGFA